MKNRINNVQAPQAILSGIKQSNLKGNPMGHNIGTIDKVIRIAALLTIATLYFMQLINGTISMALFGIAIYIFMTAVMAYCPVLEMLNISTLETKKYPPKRIKLM